MTPPHPRLVALQQRVLRIRRTVVAVAVAMFIAVFSTIYVQMASGNDPALATTTSATTSTTTSDSDTNSTSTATTDEPAPVTTRQS
jgi:hypothetical protein